MLKRRITVAVHLELKEQTDKIGSCWIKGKTPLHGLASSSSHKKEWRKKNMLGPQQNLHSTHERVLYHTHSQECPLWQEICKRIHQGRRHIGIEASWSWSNIYWPDQIPNIFRLILLVLITFRRELCSWDISKKINWTLPKNENNCHHYRW